MVLPQVSKPEDLQEVGSKIRFLRKEKKMSQLELAEAIGVTQNTIYLIETGQSEMKLGKLFSIAEVLDVTPDKLLPNEAKTTSNKLFEIEYLWKQLGEADQTIMHSVMTIKNFITKGILPILLIGIITWLGQYIFMVDGSIDWFRFMLVYGVPIGIPYMFIIIPARWDLSGTIGMVALCAAIGAVFGFIVTIGIGIRAVWYVIAFPVSRLIRKGKSGI